MPQAIVDPEELRYFARNLKKFNTELRDKSTSLHNQLTALGGSWRDQEHKKFVDPFSPPLPLSLFQEVGFDGGRLPRCNTQDTGLPSVEEME